MIRTTACALATCLAFAACNPVHWRATFGEAGKYGELDTAAPFLKCHTKGGSVYVLRDWAIDRRTGGVRGWGGAYGPRRVAVDRGSFDIAGKDIVLLETNRPEAVPRTVQ